MEAASSPANCPLGTLRNVTGAAKEDDCFPCTAVSKRQLFGQSRVKCKDFRKTDSKLFLLIEQKMNGEFGKLHNGGLVIELTVTHSRQSDVSIAVAIL